ncbi:MAG: hypothetical protein WC333_04845 [Dehalococcoidia bacterium]|jgi:hypothetical protein
MGTCYRCHYFNNDDECIIHKLKEDKQIIKACDSFIDKDFEPRFSDSCGILNWPKAPSFEDNDAELCQEP